MMTDPVGRVNPFYMNRIPLGTLKDVTKDLIELICQPHEMRPKYAVLTRGPLPRAWDEHELIDLWQNIGLGVWLEGRVLSSIQRPWVLSSALQKETGARIAGDIPQWYKA